MTADMYLQQILNKKAQMGNSTYQMVYCVISPIIQAWAGSQLEEIFESGSSAKGTALKGKSDVDVFLSIKSTCDNTLKQIFDSLESKLQLNGYVVRRQNVSLRIIVLGNEVDLVPGKKDLGNTNFHKLYVSKKDTYKQTNVKLQVKNIKDSQRQKFIQLTKIWRDCHKLEFPSINIELAILESLKYCAYDISLRDGFVKILNYLKDNIETVRLVDPGNTNNIISDDMTVIEKAAVAQKARICLTSNWEQTIW